MPEKEHGIGFEHRIKARTCARVARREILRDDLSQLRLGRSGPVHGASLHPTEQILASAVRESVSWS
jgi:hypothetical protein